MSKENIKETKYKGEPGNIKIDFDRFVKAYNEKFPELRQMTKKEASERYGTSMGNIMNYNVGKTPDILRVIKSMVDEGVLTFEELVIEIK